MSTARRLQIAPLLEYIPELSPRFVAPKHLAPLIARLERARLEPLRLVVSVPPRHAKTESLLHFVAWLLAQDPATQIVYASYAARLAEKKSRKARDLARKAGVPMSEDASSRSDWRTGVADGGVWATGVEGALTGEGADVALVDDPHKDRASAESALQRQAIFDWYTDVVVTRCEPRASIIVCQTRWHQDDLAGRLIAQGYESIVLPALDAEGRALWPERFSADDLAGTREAVGEYTWESLYQQRPRPRSGQLFRDVTFYDDLPGKYRIGKGCDLAYTAKTRADQSAAVVMLESGGVYYVVDVRTARVKVPDFIAVMAGVDRDYPGQWHWYTSTTETGVADLATATAGVHILPERAAADKFVRAQSVSAAWNAGKVLLPRRAPWLDSFVAEVCGFTGVGDRHDDQVDALSSAFVQAGGVFAMREKQAKPPAVNSAAWWDRVDRAMAKPPKVETYAEIEARGIRSDEKAARQRLRGDGRHWWQKDPLAGTPRGRR